MIYDARHGDWRIRIAETGTTQDEIDWQIVGIMQCHNLLTNLQRNIGLVWDEHRILTDYEGVDGLTVDERDALNVAGFNLFNFED